VNPAAQLLDTDFDRATAVRDAGGGRYATTIDDGWSAPRGPNGGYLAAIVLRAMGEAVGDPARAPRSLTCHYLRPPALGPAEVQVTVERAGNVLSSLSARLVQDGQTCVTALAAFAVTLESALDYEDEQVSPRVPAPETLEPIAPIDGAPAIFRRFEARPTLGGWPFQGGDAALAGGWLRLAQPRVADAVAVCLYADGWMPAPYYRLDHPVPAPTIDLTVHFRSVLPLPGADPADPVLFKVASRTSREGFFEEDGLIWSRDGTLLANSRQLALLRP
jgi:acyl-CoA thioesterase